MFNRVKPPHCSPRPRRDGWLPAPRCAAGQSGEVNVYTYRETKLIQPLFDAFTKDTGIKVNVDLGQLRPRAAHQDRRRAQPGRRAARPSTSAAWKTRSPPASRQPIVSPALDKVVAPQYRDPEGHWYAISMRARVIYASKERVKQDAITYDELADPKWKGKICIRSGQHIYNNALIAAYIAKHGEAKAEEPGCAA